MKSIIFKSIVTLIFLIITFIGNHSVAAECGSFKFPKISDLSDSIELSIAKVYSDETGNNYRGTATVIDVERGLLITASHVAKDDVVYLNFPILRNKIYYRAKIEKREEEADGKDEGNGKVWNKVRDIAILKMDVPPFGISAVEIWFECIDRNKKYYFYGFNDNSAVPIPGVAGVSIPTIEQTGEGAICTFELRESTESGDSGSPVIDESGLLIGVIIQEKNNHRSGRFIPSQCFGPMIVDLFKKEVAPKIIKAIQHESIFKLMRMLKPSQKMSELWITNLRFAAAIEIAAQNDIEARRIASKHECPVRPAIIERGVGYHRYDPYCNRILSINELKEEAEIFHKQGILEEKNNNTSLALVLYNSGAKSYDKVKKRIVNKLEKGKNIENLPNPEKLMLAQSMKGLADLQLIIGSINNEDNLFNDALENAATAAYISPNEALKGSALATMGSAAQKIGKQQIAIEAYSAAALKGFEASWVSENYNHAFKIRDNVRNENSSKDYKSLGNYQTLGDSDLEVMAIDIEKDINM